MSWKKRAAVYGDVWRAVTEVVELLFEVFACRCRADFLVTLDCLALTKWCLSNGRDTLCRTSVRIHRIALVGTELPVSGCE